MQNSHEGGRSFRAAAEHASELGCSLLQCADLKRQRGKAQRWQQHVAQHGLPALHARYLASKEVSLTKEPTWAIWSLQAADCCHRTKNIMTHCMRPLCMRMPSYIISNMFHMRDQAIVRAQELRNVSPDLNKPKRAHGRLKHVAPRKSQQGCGLSCSCLVTTFTLLTCRASS